MIQQPKGLVNHGRPTGDASNYEKGPQLSVRAAIILSGPTIPGRTVKRMTKICTVLGHVSTKTVKWGERVLRNTLNGKDCKNR
ncbi:hypothetical protein TNCV_2345941 [Trichonephila clavipes]|nr:hypothetical protein TNCV_2345941 [Trichonephila clavipes]